jgi:hypothetical protein
VRDDQAETVRLVRAPGSRGAYSTTMPVRRAAFVCSFSLLAACVPGFADRTFEPGVEHLPGSAWYLILIEPDEAVEGRDIVIRRDGEDLTRVADLLSTRDRAANHGSVLETDGTRRFVSGITLPMVLSAAVDGVPCAGVLELVVGRETDATLSIDTQGCSLHGTGSTRPRPSTTGSARCPDPYAVTGAPVRATRSMRSAARTVPDVVWMRRDIAASRWASPSSARSSSTAPVNSASSKP